MTHDIWILGASGRVGRAVAAVLAARKLPLVLVGRDAAKLREFAGSARVVEAAGIAEIAAQLPRDAVVVNTIGPFAETAPPIAAAAFRYVDVSNELDAITALLAMDAAAKASGRTLVAGAGFGFVSTESVVRTLCANRPTPARVRVDSIPFVAGSGVVGDALAASIVGVLAGGGRRYRDGRLVRARPGSEAERITLPDGAVVTTGAVPAGDLLGAQLASGAPDVVACTSEVPMTAASRVMLPIVSSLASLAWFRRRLQRMIARTVVKAPTHGRTSSWARARVEWPDGETREAWFRAGDGMTFTAASTAEVAARLATDDVAAGAFTACGLFGPDLARAAGATIEG
ncbi:MAG TPA: saccharopine dehydrogenase NADP-binding domain-containing protein [Kofleriaceae bacterium]